MLVSMPDRKKLYKSYAQVGDNIKAELNKIDARF
jgi:hypothetical protein